MWHICICGVFIGTGKVRQKIQTLQNMCMTLNEADPDTMYIGVATSIGNQ